MKELPPRRIDCPSNNEGCKYQPNCQADTVHHTYPRRLVKALEGDPEVSEEQRILAKRFINLPMNKVVSCRMIHDFLDTVAYEELPSFERMEREVNG